MGIRFFKIVGVVSYIAATLALIVAIGFAVMAGVGFVGRVDDVAKQPKPSFDEFLQKQRAEAASRTQSDTPPESSLNDNEPKIEDQAFQAKLTPLLNRVYAAVNRFGAATNQGSVEPAEFEKYLLKRTDEFDQEKYLAFLSSLGDAMEALASRSAQIAALPETDPGYVKWEQYVTWFTTTYIDQYHKEQRRIEEEKIAQEAERMRSLTLLAAAGSAFLAFVFFTMILLLVQIEANTRHSREALSAVRQAIAGSTVNEHAAAIQEAVKKVELNTRATALSLRPKTAPAPRPG